MDESTDVRARAGVLTESGSFSRSGSGRYRGKCFAALVGRADRLSY
jgi:hypothetical protein